LERQIAEIRQRAAVVPAERETFRYAPGKWSIREIVGHLNDAERVFGYRAFCISRGERKPLPGFDEQRYVAEADSNRQPLAALVEEFAALRAAKLVLFRRLDPRAFKQIGTANDAPISVRALAFILAGHVRHHLGVLQLRYGI
jgi:hypothetical protein